MGRPHRKAAPALAKSVSIVYFCGMSKLEEIQAASGTLSLAEQERLRVWLEELAAQHFDAAIERDAAAGKLDALMERARANAKEGRRQKL